MDVELYWPETSMSDLEFLTGDDDFDEGDLDIDDIFSVKTLTDILRDVVRYEDMDKYRENIDCAFRSISDPSLIYVAANYSLFLTNGETGEVIGGYIHSDLILDKAYHGRGLGQEIVMVKYALEGELPVWNLDTPAFSRAGYACHLAALRLAKRSSVQEALSASVSNQIDTPKLRISVPGEVVFLLDFEPHKVGFDVTT